MASHPLHPYCPRIPVANPVVASAAVASASRSAGTKTYSRYVAFIVLRELPDILADVGNSSSMPLGRFKQDSTVSGVAAVVVMVMYCVDVFSDGTKLRLRMSTRNRFFIH